MLQIKTDTYNRVVAIYYLEEKKEGWIEIDSIPEPEPQEEKIPVMYYRDGQIVYEYVDEPEISEAEAEPELPPYDYNERVNELIRERYSLSEELAILRQRDTKPEEFVEYNAFAEECKAKAREERI